MYEIKAQEKLATTIPGIVSYTSQERLNLLIPIYPRIIVGIIHIS